MSVQDPTDQLWGGETTKAVANFPVSGERVPVAVLRCLGRVKGAAARANAASRRSSAGSSRFVASSSAARWTAEGKTSLDDWPMFTWSFG